MALRDFGTRNSLQLVPLSDLSIRSNHNPRMFDTPEMKQRIVEMALSIKAIGVLEPIIVEYSKHDNKLYIVDGETRWRAAVYANKELGASVKAVQCKGWEGNEQERTLAALAANSGKPLEKWEAGSKFKQLRAWGWLDKDIAAQVVQSERYVREAIELCNSPAEVKAMMASNQVTERAALKTVRAKGNGAAAIQALVTAVKANKAAGNNGPVKAERKTKEADILAVIKRIDKDCGQEFRENEFATGEAHFDHISVRASLLKELLAFLD